MTLATIQELFEIVKNTSNLDDLYERKMSLTQQISEMHRKLHAIRENQGNMVMPGQEKADILMVINSASTLMEYLNERIDIVGFEMRQSNRNGSLKNKFMLVCKKTMKKEKYEQLISIAKRYGQEELEKMEVLPV